MSRVLRIHRTRPCRTCHGRARTRGCLPGCALCIHLGTADYACCASWKALRVGKEVYHWDDCGANVAGNVYVLSFGRATFEPNRTSSPSDLLGCPKNVMDAEPRRTSRAYLFTWPRLTPSPAWVYLLSLFACAQAALLGLQTSFGPAFFLPRRVRHSI
jgi:hypothetical protein